MPKIVNFVIKEQQSKKGNVYKAMYAVTEDGHEIFVCYVNLKK